jgi:hypothetical protein
MKKTLLFCFLLTSFLFFTNCSKVESVLNTGIMECKVDGTAWKSTVITTFYKSFTSPESSTITGISTDTKEILIQLSKVAAVGTYSLAIDSNAFIATYIDASQKSFISTSGVVQITEVDADGKISGNFHFNCKEVGGAATVTVTEGTFNKVVKK